MDFDDPLASYVLAISSRHPSPETPQPEPSKGQRKALDTRVNQVLRNYTPLPDESEDDTVEVFQAFLKHLSGLGQATLRNEIIHFADEPVKLRMLRNFLVDAILKPCKDYIMWVYEVEVGCINEEFSDVSGRQKSQAPYANAYPKCWSGDCITEIKATIWWALYRYFPFISGKIGTDTINEPENAITLWTEAHHEFGKYNLALEPDEKKQNRYRTHMLNPNVACAALVHSVVHMKCADESIPMPDPDFLKVHFQVSKILQVSGIGKKIKHALRANEYNPINDIQPDGSTDLGRILSCKMLMDI
ncbi:hypothetical protein ACHAQJ_006877 [Trichoderma viride]